MIWLATLAFVGVALALRLRGATWAYPPAFFALLWSILLILPLLFAPGYYKSPLVPWLILAFAVFLNLGCELGVYWYRKGSAHVTYRRRSFHSKYIYLVVYLGVLAGFLAVVYLLASTGRGISALFNLESLVRTGSEYAIARYHAGIDPPATARTLLALDYVAALVAGTSFPFTKGRRRWICIAPFLPALMYSTVLTARSPVLYVGLLWGGGFLSAQVLLHQGRAPFFTPKNIVGGGAAVTGLVMLFISLQMIRAGSLAPENIFMALERQKIWFFGYYSGLSRWLDQYAALSGELGWGAYSYAGVFDFLGIKSRVTGIYQDFVPINNYDATNIFTMFRGFVEDFGLKLSLAYQFLLGIIVGGAYQSVRQGRLPFVGILAAFYSIVLWSHVTHLLNYNTIILAFVLFSVFLITLSNNEPRYY
jgi:oligosaccharide repeat unit polymerase